MCSSDLEDKNKEPVHKYEERSSSSKRESSNPVRRLNLAVHVHVELHELKTEERDAGGNTRHDDQHCLQVLFSSRAL